MEDQEIIYKIKESLEKMRFYLQSHGGDVEFVKLENGIVFIKMIGACVDCHFQDQTVSDGISELLITEVPGIIDVEVVK